MVKKCSVWLLTASLLYVLQSSFFSRIAWHGFAPDLILLFTVSFSFLYGSRFGVWMGFMVGLIMDLASGTFFGFNTFSKMLTGYACGSFSKQVFKEQMILPMTAVSLASVGQYFLFIGILLMMGYSIDVCAYLGRTFIPMILMNIFPSLLVHFLVREVDARLKEEKQ